MILLFAVAVLATSDIVTATALMRAMIYLVPLVLVLRVFPGRQWVLLKLGLAGYALSACATVLGASREAASLLSMAPAVCLALSVINWSTTAPSK
jgi:hypothetical protein